MEPREGYFGEKWLNSRHWAASELRRYIEHGAPEPEADWNVIWIFSGPQEDFDGQFVNPGERPANYNQTKKRWETGLDIARRVTALRLRKPPQEVTRDDFKKAGPLIYYNATDRGNKFFREFCKPGGRLETEFNFPSEKVKITDAAGIKHSGHQFEDFPLDLTGLNQKIVMVSDLYHYPRLKRYIEKFSDKIPLESALFYAAQPENIPIRDTLEEVKKIYPYSLRDFISAEPE